MPPATMSSEDIARICHASNAALRLRLGQAPMPPWEERSQAQRAGMVAAVENVLADPALTPRATHEAWLATYVADGWTWGPAEDRVAKVHPSLKPWDELPGEERAKGQMFVSMVRALAPVSDFEAAKAVRQAGGGD